MNRRTFVEEVPDDESPSCSTRFDGAAAVIAHLLESRIATDFSQLPQGDWGPFPSKAAWDIAQWAKTEAVSNGAIDRLLNIAALNAQLDTKSVRDINRRVDALPSPATFQYSEISVDAFENTFDLYWRDPLEVIADLLSDPTYADHLTFVPIKHYADSEGKTRIYNELPSGDWMYETQVRTRTVPPRTCTKPARSCCCLTGQQSFPSSSARTRRSSRRSRAKSPVILSISRSAT